MYFGKDDMVAPVKFKKAMGAFQPMFSGYSQQDSGEFLSYLLDGLHEDLNRIKKKEYIEGSEDFTRPDHVMAEEAWSNFKTRNNSVIVDYLYGQYKSTVECSSCPNFSITFDPFLILQLPIPLKKTKSFEFYICNEKMEFIAKKVSYEAKDVPSLRACYERACKEEGIMIEENFYAYAASSYFGEHVNPASDEIESIRKNYKDRKTVVLRSLRPWEQGIPAEKQTNLIVSNYYMTERDYYQRKCIALVKMVLVNRDWTLAQVLSHLLSDYRHVLPEYDEARSVEQNFQPLFEEGKLKVNFCKSFGLNCPFCDKRCDGCSIPFSSAVYDKVFKSEKVEFEINWNRLNFDKVEERIEKRHGELTTGYTSYYYSKSYDNENSEPCNIEDCFRLFEETEILDKDNMWYCSKCKEFVCARKTMQIYKLPPVLIICLKRFKSQNKLYMKKINSLVHYPVTQLPVGTFAIREDDKAAKYNLFGVSNHMGGMGGGHYTAHCLDERTGKWVEYDDSHIRLMDKPREPDSESYILFYQRQPPAP
jgi:ubiquitin carboxyl-terminal hydrolase 4/11/15